MRPEYVLLVRRDGETYLEDEIEKLEEVRNLLHQGPHPWLFISLLIITIGLGFPLFSVSLDSVYSLVLGEIDQVTKTPSLCFLFRFQLRKKRNKTVSETVFQSIMQSLIILAEDVVMILAPIYVT